MTLTPILACSALYVLSFGNSPTIKYTEDAGTTYVLVRDTETVALTISGVPDEIYVIPLETHMGITRGVKYNPTGYCVNDRRLKVPYLVRVREIEAI